MLHCKATGTPFSLAFQGAIYEEATIAGFISSRPARGLTKNMNLQNKDDEILQDSSERIIVQSLARLDGTALGIALGLPVVWLGAKYAEKELFRMKVFEPASIVAALAILVAAALAATLAPALTSAHVIFLPAAMRGA